MNERMSKFDLSDVAFIVCGILAGALGTAFYYESQPSLPYTRPHIEDSSPGQEDCVGWYLNEYQVVLGICEGKRPQLGRMTPEVN